MSGLTLFLGERNSGKSIVAERFALQRSERPTYGITLPTCTEFADRIFRHRVRRSDLWDDLDLVVPHKQALGRLAERAALSTFILVDGLATLFWVQFSLFGRSRYELDSLGKHLVRLIAGSSTTEWVLVDCPAPLPSKAEFLWFNELMDNFYCSLREALPHEVIHH